MFQLNTPVQIHCTIINLDKNQKADLLVELDKFS